MNVLQENSDPLSFSCRCIIPSLDAALCKGPDYLFFTFRDHQHVVKIVRECDFLDIFHVEFSYTALIIIRAISGLVIHTPGFFVQEES